LPELNRCESRQSATSTNLNHRRNMPQRKSKKHRAGELISKIRKPMAPPSQTIEDPTKYKRERELEKLRREEKSGNS
jgi:hypothetical protein